MRIGSDPLEPTMPELWIIGNSDTREKGGGDKLRVKVKTLNLNLICTKELQYNRSNDVEFDHLPLVSTVIKKINKMFSVEAITVRGTKLPS